MEEILEKILRAVAMLFGAGMVVLAFGLLAVLLKFVWSLLKGE